MLFPHRFRGFALAILGAVLAAPAAPAQSPQPPEKQAEVLLSAGRKAYNEGNLPVAGQQFRDLLAKFGNTPQANAARYGLALVLIHSPEQDFAKAIENLNPVANDGAFPERGQAMSLLASCQRSLGLRELEKGPSGKSAADQRFGEAHKWFVSARDWFAGLKKDDEAGRARCDQAEMELRLGKVKEARGTCEPFAKDPGFAKNKNRQLGLYFHGLASFLDRDFQNAGRSLNQADLKDPVYGPHVRYLVGRVLHLEGQTAEAAVYYDGVLADHEKLKKDAAEALKQTDRFKNDPAEKKRLERLASGPAPEYVAGAAFHGACVNYEAGKFPEALGKFQTFAKDFPTSPLAPDAQLRVGFCQVQLKQNDEAAKTLTPLTDAGKFPTLADQALLWLGKAQFATALTADPNNPADRDAKTKTALDTYRKAIERVDQLAGSDAEAKARRPEMRFDYADTLQAAKHFKDAVPIYEQLWNEQAFPTRRDELLQRIVSAQGAAGNLDASNQRCDEFRRSFKDSPLMPLVMFRQAENSYARAQELGKANDKNRAQELKQRYTDAASRYKEVSEKYPEFDRVNYARFGAGVCLAQLGDVAGAIKSLDGIPAADRNGDLAGASYLLADCLIRQTPAKAEDAIAENEIRTKLTNAAGLLDSYVSANPKSPDTPAALLKLGYCRKRLGASLADANERNQTLNSAREVYDKIVKEFPQHPIASLAMLEKAKVKALMGDRGGAINDLKGVAQADIKNTPVAPLAALHMASLLRELNNPAEAAKVLDDARRRYEGPLAGDPEKSEWVHLLRYHHGVAILETGKPHDARPLFEQVVKEATGKPIAAEAALRSGQCAIAEGKAAVDAGWKLRNESGGKPEKVAAADQKIQRARESIHHAADQLVNRADQFKNTLPNADGRARMYYDAAWANRWLAEAEVNRAREELQKSLPPGKSVDRAAIPVQPAESRIFDAYRKLAEEFPESAISVDGRFEHAELLADRGDHENAVKLLKEALDKEPTDAAVPADTTERIRLRLGGSLYARKDFAGAGSQFEAVASNPKSPYLAQALYRAGECLLAAGEGAKAAEKLVVFRDKGEFHNVGGVSDRAVLRLGQAYLAAKNWDAARQSFDTFLQRYGNSPYAADARFGIGFALQNQGKFDDAINAYSAVIAATNSEIAARSQVKIGECRLAQGKKSEAAAAFLLAAYGYDYPEIVYAAALSAALAQAEDGKPADAERVLRKLLKDAPKDSEWAKAAQERLEKLKK